MSTETLFRRFYYSKPGWLGGDISFRQLCGRSATTDAHMQILEIGPGPSGDTSAFLSTMGYLTGLDVTQEALANKHLNKVKIFDGRSMPFADNSFDLCVSDWVLEHVEFPEEHFREVARILKLNGVYCLRTMNLWHYVSMGSRLLPFKLHLLLSWRLRGVPADGGAHDPYPTFYRANTKARIEALARKSGLQVERLDRLEFEPSYGRAHALLFYPMMMYERIVNRWEILSFLRVTMVAVMRKPARADSVLPS